MSRVALHGGPIALPDRIVHGQALLIDNDKIVGVVAPEELGDDVERVDVGGRLIAPGLIDIHMHGALGRTFVEATPDAFATILEETARRGITGLLATTSTAPMRDLVACLACVREWMGEAHAGTPLLGAHVEGPYFAPAQAGAQDPANILSPDDGTSEQLLAFADVIRILTLAPELPGALALIEELAARGIVAAAGHSNASDEQVLAALDAGLKHVIHIWSAQSTTVREGPWRKPGLLEATLTYDGFSVEMIADNKHLPRTLMRLAYKCLGPDRLCAISDATSGAGLPDGSRFRMGELEYEVCDGVGMLFDRTAFAGSATLLNQMIPVLTEVVGIPLPEALRMASLTPARVLGLAERKGSLEAGKDADIAIFNPDWSAWGTMVAGQWRHQVRRTLNAGC